MAHRTRQKAEKTLQQLIGRVSDWRATRQKLSPMPADPWSEATPLAREFGVNAVRVAAGIDYGALRRRVEAEPDTSRAEVGEAQRFVELDGAAVFGAGGPVIEITDTSGTRLTVRLVAGSEVDLGRLVDAFRELRLNRRCNSAFSSFNAASSFSRGLHSFDRALAKPHLVPERRDLDLEQVSTSDS